MINYAEENLELQEKLLELQRKYDTDVAELRARNAELENLIARKPEDAERECFHKGIKFRCGPKTRGKWQPFCPKCGLPVNDVPAVTGINRWALCSAHCGWVGAPLDLAGGMDAVIAELVA